MPSRLPLAGPPDPSGPWLSGLPVPLAEGHFPLARLMGQVLAWLDHAAGYPELMAATGLAFTWACPCPLAPEPDAAPPEALLSALGRLGWSRAGLRRNPSPPEAREIVVAETSAGRPVLGQGWAPALGAWCLLAGLTEGGLVVGYTPLGEPGAPYLAAPPPVTLLLWIGEPGPGEELFPPACRQAAGSWQRDAGCGATYRAWQWLLRSEAGSPLSVEPVAAALTALVEARAAALEFLQRQAAGLPELPEAWAQRAAEAYARLLERLEPLAEQLSGPQASRLWGLPEYRAALAEALAWAEGLDAEAAVCLRQAPAADYEPDPGEA